MGYCAQGPGHVIKITGTKERRQSHNTAGDLVEEEEEKNITSSPPSTPHLTPPHPPKKMNFWFSTIFQMDMSAIGTRGGGLRGRDGHDYMCRLFVVASSTMIWWLPVSAHWKRHLGRAVGKLATFKDPSSVPPALTCSRACTRAPCLFDCLWSVTSF